MNEFRKSLVRKVFKKLDPQKSGSADLMDLKKLYSARSHPLVVQGWNFLFHKKIDTLSQSSHLFSRIFKFVRESDFIGGTLLIIRNMKVIFARTKTFRKILVNFFNLHKNIIISAK